MNSITYLHYLWNNKNWVAIDMKNTCPSCSKGKKKTWKRKLKDVDSKCNEKNFMITPN